MSVRTNASLLLAVLAVSSFVLVGCSTGGDDTAAGDTSSSAASQAPVEETPSATPTATAASGVQKVSGEKITDDQMGHVVQADEIVRSFPWSDAQSGLADRDDNEQVLVHVGVTAGTKFYSGVDCSSLAVFAHGKHESWESQGTTPVIEDEMQAAGYPALQRVEDGDSGEGWCAYSVTDPSDQLDFVYKRNAAAANDGTVITKKDFVVELQPAS